MRKPVEFKVEPSKIFPYSAETMGKLSGNKEAVAIGKLLNTLSTLFPLGEEFFVDSVREFRKELRNTPGFVNGPLDKDIGTFIGHEAFHTHAHHTYNTALYSRGYVDPSRLLRALLGLARKSPLVSLHATSVLEHYTATLARLILDTPSLRELLGTAELELWDYHANDEWDHRAVTHSVLVLVDKHRGYMIVPVSIVFFIVTLLLYVLNGGKYNHFIAKKLYSTLPVIGQYLRRDFTP